MHVYRIHIRPKGGTSDMQETFSYCLNNQILGVGWRTDSNKNTKDWNEYYRDALLSGYPDSELKICKYIQRWIEKDDLVWTRNTNGKYYLALVLSGWEYWISAEAKAKDIDIANVFRCKVLDIPIDFVPGRVVAGFRSPRSIQGVNGVPLREYCKKLWNERSRTNYFEVASDQAMDIFDMFDDEDTEDIVFLYLQDHGWRVVPNSRKGDTMSFEYLVVHPETNNRGVVQVKTGEESIDLDAYSAFEEMVFLFHPRANYSGGESDKVECIPREDVEEFLVENLKWLPQHFRIKSEMARL